MVVRESLGLAIGSMHTLSVHTMSAQGRGRAPAARSLTPAITQLTERGVVHPQRIGHALPGLHVGYLIAAKLSAAISPRSKSQL